MVVVVVCEAVYRDLFLNVKVVVPPPTLLDQFGPLMVVFLKVIVMGRVRPFLTPRVQFFSLFLLKDFKLALSLLKIQC